MRLYLMQHGKARPKEEDPDRSLSDEGRAEVGRVAGFLAKTDVVRSLPILHSGKTRARQTAEGLARAVEGARVEEVERNLSTTMGHSTGLIREQCPVW